MRPIVAIAVLLAACDRHPAAPTPTPTPTVDAQPTPAAIHVRVVGTGRPMILIPGLACDGSVWRGAEARFAAGWQLHVVELAGFAGHPAIPPPFLDTVRQAIVDYVATQRLDHPVVIGHSLGAMVALWVVGSAPERFGPVVALDGVPFGAALSDPGATPATTRTRAEALRARVAAISDADKPGQARLMFAPMVTAPADLDAILRVAARADVRAVGQAMYELLTTDARPAAARITTPVLMLVAGDHFAGDPAPDLAPYEAQLAGARDHRIAIVPAARHFVMLDAPARVYDEIERFVAAPAR
ncbi:MAG: alpha/beta hydrolase [Myxococcales bacterium]|nr:alpha/beta hydrolase [Myxococcales bacterium]